jgi:hypothetical protein
MKAQSNFQPGDINELKRLFTHRPSCRRSQRFPSIAIAEVASGSGVSRLSSEWGAFAASTARRSGESRRCPVADQIERLE